MVENVEEMAKKAIIYADIKKIDFRRAHDAIFSCRDIVKYLFEKFIKEAEIMKEKKDVRYESLMNSVMIARKLWNESESLIQNFHALTGSEYVYYNFYNIYKD